MTTPAVWDHDPICGHQVKCAYQTHYCSYIRVPRLLTLQSADSAHGKPSPDNLLLTSSLQWTELWFKVLLTDLRVVLQDRGATFESAKLLRRGIELFKLLDQQLDLCESILVRELGITHALRETAQSDQLRELERLSHRLPHRSSTRLNPVIQDYLARFRSYRSRFQKLLKNIQTRKKRAPTYAEWLRLPELLALQTGVKAAWTEMEQPPRALMMPETISADENMFIIVHQCFELWFQVILDHIDRTITLIARGKIADATRLMRRVVQIARLLVQQIEIPATMLPLDFARFREQRLTRDGKVYRTGLSPASGTESYQFREIEIVCGLRDDSTFRNYLGGNEKLQTRFLTPRQAERLTQPTLADAFREAVQQRGIQKFDDLFTPANVPNPNSDLADLADTLVAFDEQFRFWRFAHVSMVEKMIGAKSGTGYLGPEYLMETAGIKIQEKNRIFEERQIRPRFFEELWKVRTRLGSY